MLRNDPKWHSQPVSNFTDSGFHDFRTGLFTQTTFFTRFPSWLPSSAFSNFKIDHTAFEVGKSLKKLAFFPLSALQNLLTFFKSPKHFFPPVKAKFYADTPLGHTCYSPITSRKHSVRVLYLQLMAEIYVSSSSAMTIAESAGWTPTQYKTSTRLFHTLINLQQLHGLLLGTLNKEEHGIPQILLNKLKYINVQLNL